MTSETILPADDEMHVLLNGGYQETLQLLACNRAALDALIEALLHQPEIIATNGSGGKIASQEELESGVGEVLQEGGTLSGEEVRRIVRELGDEEYLDRVDSEKAEFL